MSDSMKVQPFRTLLKWVLTEYDQNHSIFGIHRSHFYSPQKDSPFVVPNLFGSRLGTPIGPAAGPHTQLAQNIVSAWLTGARFIELKTVQVNDTLEIPRPCIDVEDEGYNVEWSQELRLSESVSEYVKAWALIHILNRLLGWEGFAPHDTIFNMSVGYNLEGIQTPAMTRFMDILADASEELSLVRALLKSDFPQFVSIEIPDRITNNVTLSTMHGCPPDEIERIARYLLEARGLHTTVKLNPTLLGKERVLDILNRRLGFAEITIPDSAFEHDLKYDRAVALIHSLQETAARHGLVFGVKLSNTLALNNHRTALPGGEMYMSGRALYPITINLFQKLAYEFKGNLNVSYSAGADAINTPAILAAGALPVTVATDLLKPGGYARFPQYLENLEAEMHRAGANSLAEFAADKLAAIDRAAEDSLSNLRYKKEYHPFGLPKVKSGLGFFDCITAPCMEPCAVHQNVPEYAWLIAHGEYDRALEVILARNPLPGVTGYVCTHLCQTRCTRNDYEEPVAIRALKRVAVENGHADLVARARKPTGRRVAVIGAGPSGLAAACFLALNGVAVTAFEAKETPGGMLRMIPSFRLPDEIIQEDIDRITALGVEIKTSHPVTRPPETLLAEGFDAVYLAAGFQKDMPLEIEGAGARGVYAALDLLERARRGESLDLGRKALIIGGGDTAMDSARVARRVTGNPATILYRRTRAEMPADPEELDGALEEGTLFEELVTPKRVIVKNGRVVALECLRNRLGEPDASGRRRPVVIEGSEFIVEADSIVTAIGQQPELYFLDGSQVTRHRNGSVSADAATGRAGADGIYAGGDMVVGPESIIAACGDGRRAAKAICARFDLRFDEPFTLPDRLSEEEILRSKRARIRKQAQFKSFAIPPAQRGGYELIEAVLTDEIARAEADRCLQCSSYCDKCVEVCPNRANFTYLVEPVSWQLSRLVCQGDRLITSGSDPYSIGQTRQILHLDDFCNECGNCATFCVHNGKPYREKPRLFLKEADFDLETDNAFFINKSDTGWVLRCRQAGAESSLFLDLTSNLAVYENARLRLELVPAGFQVQRMELKQPFIGEESLVVAADMLVLLKGLIATMSYLPVL